MENFWFLSLLLDWFRSCCSSNFAGASPDAGGGEVVGHRKGAGAAVEEPDPAARQLLSHRRFQHPLHIAPQPSHQLAFYSHHPRVGASPCARLQPATGVQATQRARVRLRGCFPK